MRESIPLTQQKYGAQRTALEGEREPLKQRYQNIIDDLKRREGVETGQRTTALANEYGKRGIPLSSGVYEKNVNDVLSEVLRYYGGQQKDVGFQRESDLRDITNRLAQSPIDEALQINQINQGIAGLQSGSGRDAIQMAMGLLNREDTGRQQDFSNQMAREQLAMQQKTAAEASRPQTGKYEFAQLGQNSTGYLYDPSTGQIVNTIGGGGVASSAGGGGGGGYYQPNNFTPTAKPKSFKPL